MGTNESLDFINEVENNQINTVIEPLADDDIAMDMEDHVHLIGGGMELGDEVTPEAYVMDVDSDDTFDFYIAEENYDGIVDLDNAVDAFDDIDVDADGFDIDSYVMDIDSEEAFDFDVANENADGVIDSDDFVDVSEMYSLNDLPENIRGNIIGLDKITEEPDMGGEDPGDEPIGEEWHSEDGGNNIDLESHEDLYPDSSDVDIMNDSFDDFT